ncbi:Sialic acid-binding periplasmic protein SiaP [Methylobacterium crusticola]|uniref:Sialic acid-binding periplasmic protein SiaP n=1 Tax=Methylobacterium crusticola TaxID=1697972 RepID=A0ABQ4QTD5_9HYPH|nr:TRAP transporter substrate-binding protein [Methylobacterium crusticola]GJD48593.1 Sialic acid-binding periplasmic protein SiaP [Methylobacterium crusticola]
MHSTSLRRRSLLGGAAGALACTIITRAASAAEVVLKFGNNQPANYPLNRRMREAGERIRERTSGRVELQVFPQGQLGTDTDMLSQVRSGAVELYTASGLVLSTLVPVTAINAVGFAFPGYDKVWAAMDGDLGALIRSRIEKSGLVVFDRIFDIGFRQITSGQSPILAPRDLKGFKIRIPPSTLGISMFKAFGASPTALNWSETYTALQTRVVDGQENPLSIIDTGKFFEVQKCCSLTGHMWDGFWLLGNGRFFRTLPRNLHAILAEEFARAADEDRADVAALETSMQDVLRSKGMQIAQVDPAAFRDALRAAGFYREWREKFGDEAWTALEKSTGELI